MSHESKVALERIVTICEKSENLSMNQCRIFDIALEGLGYVASQREQITSKWKQPHVDKLRERRAKRAAFLATQATAECNGYEIVRGSVLLNGECLMAADFPADATPEQVKQLLDNAIKWIREQELAA